MSTTSYLSIGKRRRLQKCASSNGIFSILAIDHRNNLRRALNPLDPGAVSDEALVKFRDSKGWEAGIDGSVALADWGSGKDINTQNYVDPIVGFVLDNKGLMAGISLEGSKITKIDP